MLSSTVCFELSQGLKCRTRSSEHPKSPLVISARFYYFAVWVSYLCAVRSFDGAFSVTSQKTEFAQNFIVLQEASTLLYNIR
jgi:hypothetical protein